MPCPRSPAHRQIDDPDTPRSDLEEALAFNERLNQDSSGTPALLRQLDQWSARWHRKTTVDILDIGTGQADVPRAIDAWAQHGGHDVRVTGIALSAATLDIARGLTNEHPQVTLEQVDPLRLMDHWKPASFDYVHAGCLLNRFHDIEVLTMLRIMHRLARRGIVWSDFVRNRLTRALVRLRTRGSSEFVRQDARAAVEGGFTHREVVDIRRRVGLPYCTWIGRPLSVRFTLAGEKPEAWL